MGGEVVVKMDGDDGVFFFFDNRGCPCQLTCTSTNPVGP